MKIRTLLLAMIVSSLWMAGCDSNDGPAERAGKAMDDTAEEVQDAAKDVGNAIEDACEDVKESANAEDTDC